MKLFGSNKKAAAKASAEVTGGLISEERGLAALMARIRMSERETQELVDSIMGSAPEQEKLVAIDQMAKPGQEILINKTAIVEHNGATIKVEQVGITRLGDGTTITDLSEVGAWCFDCGTLIKGEGKRSPGGLKICDTCAKKNPYNPEEYLSAQEMAAIEDNIWLQAEAELDRRKREKLMRKLHQAELKKLLNKQEQNDSGNRNE